ncbi:hypothetical protein, partial [Escherichia coli]|uniref:hypothetical protein n=2 Tax=Escherichia coli TaxID=562 RepID=UPI00197ACDC3
AVGFVAPGSSAFAFKSYAATAWSAALCNVSAIMEPSAPAASWSGFPSRPVPVPVDVHDVTKSASKAMLPERNLPVVRVDEFSRFNSLLRLDFPDQFGEPDMSEKKKLLPL